MPKLNENYLNLKASYLFSEIAHRTAAYKEQNPEEGAKIIRLGIGDVTLPLGKVVIDALHQGVEAMASAETFKGYGPEQGYQETRDAIAAYYKRNGVDVDAGDIFVSDGAKSDTGNITDLFGHDNVVLVPDPVYPVYVDTNIMAGNKVTYMAGNAENGFLPMPNKEQHADVIYLCSPNNPTGACYNKEQLKEWVDYALANEAVILKHLSQTRNCREVFLQLRVLRNAPSNSARSPRQPDLPEPAAATLLFRRSWFSRLLMARKCL